MSQENRKNRDPMPQLFIANKNYSSWSLRPWILMRHLQIPFEEMLVPFGSESFRRFSPSGRVPCLVDNGVAVWDSLAIVEYLAEKTPQVWPQNRIARAWARSATAEMHSGFVALRDFCTMNCGLRINVEFLPPAVHRDLMRLDSLWSDSLERFGGPFLAGSAFTAVDAFFAPVAFRAQTYDLALAALSDPCRQYVERILALPEMTAWYDAALQESWRDDHHEAEARAAGEWMKDFRARPLV